MAIDHTRDAAPQIPPGRPAPPPGVGEVIERLSRFEGPPEQFLQLLLAVQCRIGAAERGAIFRAGGDGRVEILAVHPPAPPGQTAPSWLASAVEQAPQVLAQGKTLVRPLHAPEDLYGQPADKHMLLLPLTGGTGVRGVAAFVVTARDPQAVQAIREKLETTAVLLGLYEMRLTLQRRQADMRRLQVSLETLSTTTAQHKFSGSSMSMVNELAARFQADRVGLGFLKGRYVQLKALSHTEKFSRKMELVQDLEGVMEECIDQDVEILDPAPPGATYVSRETEAYARKHGPTAIVSMPLRRDGEPVAVVTVERDVKRPFTLEEAENLRLTAELCTPWVHNLYKNDRWFGARLASSMRDGLGAVVGPKHTWLKLAAAAVLIVAMVLIFGQGDYNVDASFVIEPVRKAQVPAPYNGELGEVFVEPGDQVTAGQLLATFRTEQLQSELQQARADAEGYMSEYQQAQSERKLAEAQIALDQARSKAAEAEELERRIAQAELRAPIDGTVLQGDLMQRIGGTFDEGEALFEIAPLQTLRAELEVPEGQIVDVQRGLTGELAATNRPEQRIEFEVDRIIPVAEVRENANVFRVRVRLLDVDLGGEHAWLRPGIEGEAKIDAGRASLGYIWTRPVINWIRMKLWL